MSTRLVKFNRFFLRSWTAIIVGSMFLVTAQAAHAGHGGAFKEFRQQNAGLDRHTARKLFNAERKGLIQVSPTNSAYQVTPEGGYIRCGTESPREERLDRGTELHDVGRQSVQVNDAGRLVRLTSGVDLDLTSQDRNITLGNNLFAYGGSVQINVGGETKVLTAGSRVSAAEYVAVKQVLSGSGQKVSIDKSGVAVGGELDLGAITADNDVMRASNLVVSQNVTTTGDFGKHSDFKLLGNLDNFGSVNAMSGDSSVKSGAIRAEDINNHAGGTISSTVDLTLDASGSFANAGTVDSTGSLTINAGTGITNAGTIRALHDVSLNAAKIDNFGAVVSSNGNVSLDGSLSANLDINNNGGVVSAVNGAINVRNGSYVGAFDTALYGGDLLSQKLNLNAGNGVMNIAVDDLTGAVYQMGNAAHIQASTDVLTIGGACLTGDPTYYNTAGDIMIVGDVLVGQELVFVASGSIILDINVDVQAGDANQGYNMAFIAGAGFVANGGSNQATIGPIPPPNANNGGVTLSGKKSKTGGGIFLNQGATIFAQSTDVVGNDPGGDIDLFAFAGKSDESGLISLVNGTVSTTGKNAGVDGDVLIVGGHKAVDSVSIGTMLLNGGGDGQLQIFTAVPASDTGDPIVYDANGVRTSAAGLVAGKDIKGANVTLAHVGPGVEISASRSVEVHSTGSVFVQGDVVAQNKVDIFGKTAVLMNAATSLGVVGGLEVDLSSTGDIGESFVSDHFKVDTPLLNVNTSGGIIGVTVINSGTTLIQSANAQGTIDIRAAARTINTGDVVDTDGDIVIVAKDIGVLNAVHGSSLTIALDTGSFNNVNFGTIIVSGALNLSTTSGSIGVDANNPLDLPDGVESVNIVAQAGSAFIREQFGSEIAVSAQVGGAAFNLQSNGSIDVPVAILAQNGGVSILTTAGEIEIGDDSPSLISAFNAISIRDTSTKGKIVIHGGVQIKTSAKSVVPGVGDVLVSVGPDSVVVAPDPENVTITETGGLVNLTGSGLVAKGLVSALTATGANVNINNGNKASAILFTNEVLIEADPPVPAGTPTFVRYTPATDHDRNAISVSSASTAKTRESVFEQLGLQSPSILTQNCSEWVGLTIDTQTNSDYLHLSEADTVDGGPQMMKGKKQ